MILFTILLITLLILLVATVIGIGCIGSVGIIIFGDVIICIFLIGWILKHLVKKKSAYYGIPFFDSYRQYQKGLFSCWLNNTKI